MSQGCLYYKSTFMLAWVIGHPQWAISLQSIVVKPQALVLCLNIRTVMPLGLWSLGLCVYFRQGTRACGISNVYVHRYIHPYIYIGATTWRGKEDYSPPCDFWCVTL